MQQYTPEWFNVPYQSVILEQVTDFKYLDSITEKSRDAGHKIRGLLGGN